MELRQSTAVDVLLGPFVDKTDGATGETGESPSVKLSKNGQALGAKNDATTPVHDADGYHNCELDATDTDTVGTLTLTVAASAEALPVRHEFQVLTQDAYDYIYASDAAPDTQIAAIKAETALIVTDTGTTLQGELDAIQAAVITNAAGADIAADIIAVKAETAAIVNDTDLIDDGTSGLAKIATDVAAVLVDTATTLQGELDAIQAAVITNATGVDIAADIIAMKAETVLIVADTNELQSDDVPGLIASHDTKLDTADAAIDVAVADLANATDGLGALKTLIDTGNTASAAIQAITDLLTAAQAEPTGVPAANETPLDKLAYLFMVLRNKVTVTNTKKTFFGDDNVAEYEQDLTDDGTTLTQTESNDI